MRKILIPIAAAATALVVAAPASAQGYGNLGPAYGAPAYGAPYGNAYGYNRYGAGQWQRELQQIRYERNQLARSGRLTRSEARRLDRDIRNAERTIYRSGRYGVSPWEAQRIQQRIARLRYELRRYSDYDRRGRYYGRRDRHHDRDHDRD